MPALLRRESKKDVLLYPPIFGETPSRFPHATLIIHLAGAAGVENEGKKFAVPGRCQHCFC